jgi:hypothetical protein
VSESHAQKAISNAPPTSLQQRDNIPAVHVTDEEVAQSLQAGRLFLYDRNNPPTDSGVILFESNVSIYDSMRSHLAKEKAKSVRR